MRTTPVMITQIPEARAMILTDPFGRVIMQFFAPIGV